jgi:ubiquinol-cytochrome c reductase cytochrome b subunit
VVLLQGINEYPKPGVQVRRETYRKEYEEMLHKDGIPFVPNGIGKDLVANGVLLLIMVALALFLGPKGPEIPADPAQIISEAKPDYPFLWLLAAAALMPNGSEVILFFVLPLIAVILLFGLPFFSNQGEKHYSRRPVAVIIVILTYLTIGLLTYAGITGPWSPHMEAWSSAPMKPEFIKARSPIELQGALLFQNKQCRNCHAIGGVGGHRGPDLTTVGARMDQPELVRQVIQGGGNMPAYGNTLTPEEVSALVSFLVSLRPPHTIPALNPALPEKNERVSAGEGPKQAQAGH